MFIQRPSDNLILENPSNALERGGGGGGGGRPVVWLARRTSKQEAFEQVIEPFLVSSQNQLISIFPFHPGV